MRIAPAYPCSVVLTKNEVTEFLERLDPHQVLWGSDHHPIAWNPTRELPGYVYYRIYFTTRPDEPGIFRMGTNGYINEPRSLDTDVSLDEFGSGLTRETPEPLNLSLIFS